MWSDLERPPLRESALRRALVTPEGPYTALDVVESVSSTNTALAAAARQGAPDRSVLVAEHQSAGRGRAARSWVAPPRSGLTLSVLLRPTEVPQTRWSWLPLLVGVALCRTVSTLGELPAALKWPNDLLLGTHQRKAAGILAEVVPTDPAVVVGIGLNVTLRPEELPVPEATSLAIEQAACTDRDPLLRALLRTLDTELRQWYEHDGDPVESGVREAYQQHCATLGEQVRIELPGQPALTGTAEQIDTEGRLVVLSDGQRCALSVGDVTHVHALRSQNSGTADRGHWSPS
ncbi:MAG: BirA family transcriptional regulator [Pseudonocardiales bacterium]|jgi:BirA family biotin operon repressor/biotin-[acetyl-CoA-carboxylase] ligase|nr:BirA family transcriptional regulator [Pseudonocardiales bacterium]